MEDADLDAAVETLIDGAMFNSGQCCCGIERIYVVESLYEKFLQKAINIVENYKLGNPLEPETTIGPMANKRFSDEVRSQINEAVELGATAHIKVFKNDDGGTYVTPQILTGVDHNMRIMKDETFGPVVCIMPVSSDEEAISLMNDSEFGLTASFMVPIMVVLYLLSGLLVIFNHITEIPSLFKLFEIGRASCRERV